MTSLRSGCCPSTVLGDEASHPVPEFFSLLFVSGFHLTHQKFSAFSGGSEGPEYNPEEQKALSGKDRRNDEILHKSQGAYFVAYFPL